jgi:autophagy-related protein 2
MWTPDVKANQLADVISGVSPIRSLVNVGTGVADLVLLPIAQYRKDKRLVRGVQKGAGAFVKSTAMEAIKLGARLATGTQVILEQAEGVLGTAGSSQDVQFDRTITAETLSSPILRAVPLGAEDERFNDEEGYGGPSIEKISKYADQPEGVKEGVQTAYKSLTRNLNSAAQTILAVPMEVYERSGTEVCKTNLFRVF